MNIGMLLNAPYPSDVRVKKETGALLKAGFTIHLLCLCQDKQKREEEVEGIMVTRINAGKNNYQLAFWDVIMSITFQHPEFKKAIPGWIIKNDIHILHIHDLPLVGTALALRKKIRIPLISDFHENYPEALKAWFEWGKNPIARLKNKFFMNPNIWTKHEREATLKSDHVIAVIDEMKDRLIQNYSANADKITVISNSEERSFLTLPDEPAIYQNYPGKFIITYSGNIGPHRGVDTVIEAMQYIKQYPDIIFLIVGSGGITIMNYLKALVEKLKLQENVQFLGRQPSSRFYSFMKYADLNIIPHKSNGHTDNTVPHKLFQAMMIGKPVMVSSSAPLKRIASQTQSGVIFEASNPIDLAKKIQTIYESKELQQKLGNNGIIATTTGYMNWETEQKKLVELYQRFDKHIAESSS